MNKLAMYKRLSKEDRDNLIIYCIYDNIYDVMKDQNIALDDEEIDFIKDSAYNLYTEDEYYNLSPTKIASFITECYINDHEFFKKTNHMPYSEILEAISDSYYSFYEDYEI